MSSIPRAVVATDATFILPTKIVFLIPLLVRRNYEEVSEGKHPKSETDLGFGSFSVMYAPHWSFAVD